jgi:hypothetical protein
MPEQVPPGPAAQAVQAQLQNIARLLREVDHLDADAQRQLAELVEELSKVLDAQTDPPDEVSKLTDSAVHFVQAARHPHDQGLFSAARDRVNEAILVAEAKAPVAADITRRLVDTLSNLGI